MKSNWNKDIKLHRLLNKRNYGEYVVEKKLFLLYLPQISIRLKFFLEKIRIKLSEDQ